LCKRAEIFIGNTERLNEEKARKEKAKSNVKEKVERRVG